MRDGFFFRAMRMGNSVDSRVGQICNVENGTTHEVHSMNQGRSAAAFYGLDSQRYMGPDAEERVVLIRWYRDTTTKNLSLIVVCGNNISSTPSGNIQLTITGLNTSSTLSVINGSVTKNGGSYTAQLSWASVVGAGFVISGISADAANQMQINLGQMFGVDYFKIQTLPGSFIKMKYDKLTTIRTPAFVTSCSRFVYPDGQSYLVNTQEELDDAIATITPPTQSQIFAEWGRFAGTAWFPSGTTPTGEAASWVYDSANDRISTTVNSTNYIGFVSLEELAYYNFKVRMSSNASDDDQISMVIAFALNAQGVPCALTVVRNNGGWLFPDKGWLLVEYVGNTPTVITDGTPQVPRYYVNPGENGWAASKQTVVNVSRNRNNVRVTCSPYGSETIDPVSLIEYDIPEDSIYAGKKPYGVSCFSQQNSTYDILEFDGGLNQTQIWDVRQDPPLCYEYQNGSWVANPSLNIFWVLGEPRQMDNPITGKSYYLDGNTVTLL